MKCAHAQSAVCSCWVRVADRDGVIFNPEWSLLRELDAKSSFSREMPSIAYIVAFMVCRYHLYYVDQVSFRRSG